MEAFEKIYTLALLFYLEKLFFLMFYKSLQYFERKLYKKTKTTQ